MAFQRNNSTPKAEYTADDAVISGVIARFGNDKVRGDFRYGLQQPLTAGEDGSYAVAPQNAWLIHGRGGAKYGMKSCINIALTDYSNAGQSRKVSFNLSPDQVDMLYAVVQNRYIGSSNAESLKTSLEAIMAQYKAVLSGKPKEQQTADLVQVGVSMKNLADSIHTAWNYHVDHANNHAIDQTTGLGPVSILDINYCPVYKGKVSKYPWYIKITNGKAPIKDVGQVTYKSADLTEKIEVAINVGSEQLLGCLRYTTRFISLWEMAYGIPLIKTAVSLRSKLLTERRARKGVKTA